MTIDILGLTCRLALHSFSVLESRLSIVMFHSVLDAPDPLRRDSPGIAEFDAQIRWLSGSFRILPLREATEKLWAGRLPARALCITFDDGYRDNVVNALPVLLKYQVPATFFVTTRYTHGGMMWNDRVIEAIRAWPHDTIEMASFGLEDVALGEDRHDAALRMLGRIKYLPYDEREAVTTELLARSGARPARMMMDDAEIRDLHRAGMEIGGHTGDSPDPVRPGRSTRSAGNHRQQVAARDHPRRTHRLLRLPQRPPTNGFRCATHRHAARQRICARGNHRGRHIQRRHQSLAVAALHTLGLEALAIPGADAQELFRGRRTTARHADSRTAMNTPRHARRA
ncbi:MAG: polysaccharide deacetylase family protein [Proteobacteria bacterium]|nr:polysaccharide deacetylase family protein [Pseudomonadota bacterium]